MRLLRLRALQLFARCRRRAAAAGRWRFSSSSGSGCSINELAFAAMLSIAGVLYAAVMLFWRRPALAASAIASFAAGGLLGIVLFFAAIERALRHSMSSLRTFIIPSSPATSPTAPPAARPSARSSRRTTSPFGRNTSTATSIAISRSSFSRSAATTCRSIRRSSAWSWRALARRIGSRRARRRLCDRLRAVGRARAAPPIAGPIARPARDRPHPPRPSRGWRFSWFFAADRDWRGRVRALSGTPRCAGVPTGLHVSAGDDRRRAGGDRRRAVDRQGGTGSWWDDRAYAALGGAAGCWRSSSSTGAALGWQRLLYKGGGGAELADIWMLPLAAPWARAAARLAVAAALAVGDYSGDGRRTRAHRALHAATPSRGSDASSSPGSPATPWSIGYRRASS